MRARIALGYAANLSVRLGFNPQAAKITEWLRPASFNISTDEFLPSEIFQITNALRPVQIFKSRQVCGSGVYVQGNPKTPARSF